MKNDDGLPFDRLRWRHESGPESLGEECGTEPDDTRPIDPEGLHRGTSKTEAKRLRDLKERAGQGDRTDWESHVRWNTPPGFTVTPNSKLPQKAKTGRANSLKAAIEKRGNRNTVGRKSEEARAFGPGRRDTHPKPKDYSIKIPGEGGNYPDERYMHPYRVEVALEMLCQEIILAMTPGDAAVAGSIAYSRACRELGDDRHGGDSLSGLYRQHCPHHSYVSI